MGWTSADIPGSTLIWPHQLEVFRWWACRSWAYPDDWFHGCRTVYSSSVAIDTHLLARPNDVKVKVEHWSLNGLCIRPVFHLSPTPLRATGTCLLTYPGLVSILLIIDWSLRQGDEAPGTYRTGQFWGLANLMLVWKSSLQSLCSSVRSNIIDSSGCSPHSTSPNLIEYILHLLSSKWILETLHGHFRLKTSFGRTIRIKRWIFRRLRVLKDLGPQSFK